MILSQDFLLEVDGVVCLEAEVVATGEILSRWLVYLE